jgi:hypothetical protein
MVESYNDASITELVPRWVLKHTDFESVRVLQLVCQLIFFVPREKKRNYFSPYWSLPIYTMQ